MRVRGGGADVTAGGCCAGGIAASARLVIPEGGAGPGPRNHPHGQSESESGAVRVGAPGCAGRRAKRPGAGAEAAGGRMQHDVQPSPS